MSHFPGGLAWKSVLTSGALSSRAVLCTRLRLTGLIDGCGALLRRVLVLASRIHVSSSPALRLRVVGWWWSELVHCCCRTAGRSGWSLKWRPFLQGAVVAETSHAWPLFAKVAVVIGLLMLEALAVRRIVAVIAADLAEHVVAGVGPAAESFRGDVPMRPSSVEAAMLTERRAGWHRRRGIDESVRRMTWSQREHLLRDRLHRRLGRRLLRGVASALDSSVGIRTARVHTRARRRALVVFLRPGVRPIFIRLSRGSTKTGGVTVQGP